MTREEQAAELQRAGLARAQIAARLGMSVSWVQWAVDYVEGRGAPRPRTAGARERYLVRRGVIP